MYACANDIIYLIHSHSIILSTWDFPLENTTAQRLRSWKSTTITMEKKQVPFAWERFVIGSVYSKSLYSELFLSQSRAFASFVRCCCCQCFIFSQICCLPSIKSVLRSWLMKINLVGVLHSTSLLNPACSPLPVHVQNANMATTEDSLEALHH